MKKLQKQIRRLRKEIQSAQLIDDLDRVEDLILELDQAVDQFQVERSREDPNAFIEYAFADKHGVPLKQSSFHALWQSAVQHPTWNPSGYKRALIIAPRDHGKTTQLPVGRVIWELGNNPNLRIKIACQSDSKAMERLFEITDHMERNPKIRKVFPHLRPAQRGDWCVPIDSIVYMADGRELRVDEVLLGDKVKGWCESSLSVETAAVEHVSEIVLKPCIEVTTESGRRFRASTDHRMLSHGRSYCRAGDLGIGDPVAIGRQYARGGFGPVVEKHEARLLGYLVGDGYTATKAGGPWFTNGDNDVIADFTRCVRSMGWGVSLYADRGSYKMLGVTQGESSRSPRDWLVSHGLLGKRSNDKRIPPRVRASVGAMIEFLPAYFACDGCLDESVDRISFTTMSIDLARDLLSYLRLAGVGGRMTPDRSSGAWRISAAGWSGVKLCDSLTAKITPWCSKLRAVASWCVRYMSDHDKSLRQSDLWHEPGSAWRGGDWRRRKSTDPKTLGWEKVSRVENLGMLPCIDFTIAKPVDTFLLDDGFIAHNTKHKIVVNRELFSKDASIEALGIMSTATGGRCDLLIADDIVDRRNAIQFPQIRETIKHAWKSDWTNLLEPDGRVVYICTLWHTADLSHELIGNKAYATLAHAVSEDLTELEAWSVKPGDDRKRTKWIESLWHHWDQAALQERKDDIGTIEFDRAFRNIALSGEIVVVQPKWIRYFDPLNIPPLESLVAFQGFDLAIGKKAQHDYFATVTICVDVEALLLYVMKYYRARLSFTQQAMAVINDYLEWEPHEQRVESIAYQESLPQYLDSMIGKRIDSDGILVQRGEEVKVAKYVPALPLTRVKPRLDKMARLKAVTPYLERAQILFHPSMDPEGDHFIAVNGGDLIGEITKFPLAAKDDLADGFVHAVVGATKYLIAYHSDEEDEGDTIDSSVRIIGGM